MTDNNQQIHSDLRDIFGKLQDVYDLLAQTIRHQEQVIDTCPYCGCTELLCGHNKKGEANDNL